MKNSLASTFKSNKRYIYYYFYSSTWYICDFFLFHIEIEGKGGWIIGEAKGYVGPPSQIMGGGLAPPLPTPMIVEHHIKLFQGAI